MAARAKAEQTATAARAKWSDEITKAKKRWKTFHDAGDRVEEEYRQQREDGNDRASKDKYNILYSSTETIRPNLYAQLPTVRVVLRNKDIAPDAARDGAELLQRAGQYLITEQDVDSVLENITEDLLLPGLGVAWVRYAPNIQYEYDENDKVKTDETGIPIAKLLDEQIPIEYLFWKDYLTSASRTWDKVWWVAKRCWMTKPDAVKRFGKAKANVLSYTTRERDGREENSTADTAEVWEIWDKNSKTVFWYADSYADDVLDSKPDPLKLKNFFPTPKPLRAVSTNSRMIPRALYSQYKDQAEQVNNITRRIRLLTDALKVAGVYNGAVPKIADLISPLSGNKMIPIEDWHTFKGDGGVKGAIEWVPLTDVANALNQLLQAREVAKAEIYEITGFSDILRGVSKASETLGAQNLKSQWGAARLKRMQKEVQRFARDLIAIAAEIVAEHCSEESIALYGGVILPEVNPADPQQAQAVKPIIDRFKAAVAFIRNEGRRVANIDIETDSTILADESAEREDRMAFLGAAGAFLQQAVPAMQTAPQMGPLLAAMLMFTVRTFPSSRVIEDAFEQVSKTMQNMPPPKPEGEGDSQGKMAAAQLQAQTEQARIQADTQIAQGEVQAKTQYEMARVTNEQTAEQNRHEEKMLELDLKRQELELRRAELAVKEREADTKAQAVADDAAEATARLELDASIADDERDQNQMELDFEQQQAAVDAELREEEAKAASREGAQRPLTGAGE